MNFVNVRVLFFSSLSRKNFLVKQRRLGIKTVSLKFIKTLGEDIFS